MSSTYKFGILSKLGLSYFDSLTQHSLTTQALADDTRTKVSELDKQCKILLSRAGRLASLTQFTQHQYLLHAGGYPITEHTEKEGFPSRC